MKKLVILVTVPVVLETWLKGQPKFLSQYYEVEIITSYSDKIKNIEKYENVNIKVVEFNRKINATHSSRKDHRSRERTYRQRNYQTPQ